MDWTDHCAIENTYFAYQEFAIPEETGGDESPKVQRIKVITRDTDTD